MIAEHVGDRLRALGLSPELLDSAHIPNGFSVARYSAAIVLASVHMGAYERQMAAFVKPRLAELRAIPTAFLSVCLGEAGDSDAKAKARRTIETFLKQTCWQPSCAEAVAGALRYSKYGFVMRLIMRSLARKQGMPVDMTRDYEFTDWDKLDRCVEEFACARLFKTCGAGG